MVVRLKKGGFVGAPYSVSSRVASLAGIPEAEISAVAVPEAENLEVGIPGTEPSQSVCPGVGPGGRSGCSLPSWPVENTGTPLVSETAVVSGSTATVVVLPPVVEPPGGMPERGKSSLSTVCSPGGLYPALVVVQAAASSCVALLFSGGLGGGSLPRFVPKSKLTPTRRPVMAHFCRSRFLVPARSLERPE